MSTLVQTILPANVISLASTASKGQIRVPAGTVGKGSSLLVPVLPASSKH
jgi:hypothetical protein